MATVEYTARRRSAGAGTTGRALGLLVAVLRRRRLLFRGLVDALLELLHARAQRLGQLRQPVGAEEHEHDDENDEQFLVAQTKHDGLLSERLTLPRARATAQDPPLPDPGGHAPAVEELQEGNRVLPGDPQQVLDVGGTDLLALVEQGHELP